jgi:hypothetical protein
VKTDVFSQIPKPIFHLFDLTANPTHPPQNFDQSYFCFSSPFKLRQNAVNSANH